MPETEGEDLTKKFTDLMKSKAGITVKKEDLSVIHRISHSIKSITKPVLVKFTSTEAKSRVIRARKTIRDKTTLRLSDDVTKANVMLINRLKNHEKIDNAWYFNGRVYGQTKQGKKHKFYPYDDVDAIISCSNVL